MASRAEAGRRLVILGVLANVVLAAAKFLGGWLGNSNALMADGLESSLDILSSLMMWGALKIAERPADEGHPYGHGKVESLAAVAGSLVLILAGIALAAHSVVLLFTGGEESRSSPAVFTLLIAIVTIVVKEGLYRLFMLRGKQIDSAALLADAWHHRSDAITSLATLLGIGIAIVGGPDWGAADSFAALVSCGIILANGGRMLRNALGEVLDEQMKPGVLEAVIHAAIKVPGVTSVEKCRVRKSGLTRIADLHIRVEGSMPVREGHEIAHAAKDRILACGQNISDVTVHVEPEREGDGAPG
ncbi:MAG: cation diffusion facilitator family transporter [Terrimicrobiaceae bacterium]